MSENNIAKEKKRQYDKIYRQENKGKIKLALHDSYLKNIEKRKAHGKKMYHKNKEREIRRARIWKKNNPDKVKDSSLKRKYKISLEEYNLLLDIQNYCCAICGKHESEFTNPLFVDHCHESNEVRGLLCPHCNTAIGLLEENISVIKNALKYLMKCQ